jgi:hypothetical protein
VTARTLRVGDLVQTTDQWTDQSGNPRVRGLVRTVARDYHYRRTVEVDFIGEHRVRFEPNDLRRTIELDLITPIGEHRRAWFDPDDLEPATVEAS